MSEFFKAGQDIEDLAQELMATHHPEISGANFGYWMKDKASKTELEQGLVVVAKKVPPLFKEITGLDFVLVINSDGWVEMSNLEKTIKLDSALCCCTVKVGEDGEEKLSQDGNPIYEIKKPNLVEFVTIVDRYGLPALSQIETKLRQMLKENLGGNVNSDSDTIIPEEVRDDNEVATGGTTKTRQTKK